LSLRDEVIPQESSVCPFVLFLKKEVARGGERTRVLSISFIFSFFTTLPLSHSGSPFVLLNIIEFSPLGANKGVNNSLGNKKSPQAAQFTPRVQLMLKTGLR
jgi:hypothetical protein